MVGSRKAGMVCTEFSVDVCLSAYVPSLWPAAAEALAAVFGVCALVSSKTR